MNIEGNFRNERKEVKERIVSCAIQYKDEIYTGPNHFSIKEGICKAHPEAAEADEFVDGYMTSKDRFLEREKGEVILREERLEKEALQASWADVTDIIHDERSEKGTE